MAKHILVGKQARTASVEALQFIRDYISSTLGPSGRPILMTKRNSSEQAPVSVTKDGFNSLQALSFNDPVHDAVLQIAKQSAGRSVLASGDGTTSTITMAAAFAYAIHNSNHQNPQAAIRVYRKEVLRAVEAIEKEAVRNKEATESVVLTSSNRDAEMSENVMKAINSSSAYGSIMVISSPTSNVKFKIDKDFGYQCGRGYNYSEMLAGSLDPSANTNDDIILTSPYVFPYNGDIQSLQQITPVLLKMDEAVDSTKGFTLLIIAHDVAPNAATEIAVFNRRNATNNLKVALVKTTSTWEPNGSVEQLKDISAFSGSDVFDAGCFSSFEVSQLGQVGSVRLQPTKSFLNGKGSKNWLIKRAEENKQTASRAECQADKEWADSRNASLTGGLVKLVIGGALYSELSEIKDRADDAIKAGQACNRSGALPGCGVSYIRAGKLAGVSDPIQKALSSIHQTILSNYGMEDAFSEDHKAGKTVYVSDDEVKSDVDFLSVGVADSFETVKGVILNAFELGAVVANIGAVCLESDLEMIEKAKLLRDFSGNS